MLLTWEHFHRVNSASGQIKSDTYLRIWADFFWNFRIIATMPGAGLFRVRSFSCLQTAVCRNVSRHSQAVFPDGSSMGTNYPTHTSSSAYILDSRIADARNESSDSTNRSCK